jgi:hypothetical protein
MGRDLHYYFYDKDFNKIETRKITSHMKDDILGEISQLRKEMIPDYILDAEDEKLYELDTIMETINTVSKKYSGFQLLSFELHSDIDDDILPELQHLTALLKGALEYNKYGDVRDAWKNNSHEEEIIQVKYISFIYY